jgi:hypothetical protein
MRLDSAGSGRSGSNSVARDLTKSSGVRGVPTAPTDKAAVPRSRGLEYAP